MQINKSQVIDQAKKYQKDFNKKLEEYASNEQTWHYIEVLLAIFATTFFVIFAIKPAIVTISGLIGEIRERKQLSQQMQAKINNVIAAQEEYALIQNQRGLLDSFLPTDFGISQGITQVAGAVLSSKISPQQLSLKSVEMVNPSDELSGLELSLTSTGEYEQLRQFIRQLVAGRRWTEVPNYKIGIDEKNDEASAGQLRLSLQTKLNYWFEELYGKETTDR